MKIALVSLDQIWEDKEDNLSICEEYIKKASKEKVDLIIFPEMTLTGFSTNISLIAEDKSSSITIKKFSHLALSYNIAIIFGLVIQDGEKALNQLIFINKQSEILSIYSKIHPFTFSGENKYFNAGNSLSIANFMDLKIGFTICYDLRFPELYSALGSQCDIIINIANWPSKRVDHWSTLLKARAIENQIFIVGVNRIGVDGNGLEYVESSKIFNANGEILDFMLLDGMKVYHIDNDWTNKFKANFNTQNDRKIDLYKRIL